MMQVSSYDSLIPYPESATGYNLALSQNPIVCDAAGIPKVSTLDVTLWRKTGKDSMEIASGTFLKVVVHFPNSSREYKVTTGKVSASLASSDTIPKYVTSVDVSAGENSYDVHDIADLTVPVNKDGKDGAEGKTGRLPVPYGEYSSTVTYTATDQVAPYVLYNGQYYVMNKTTSVKGLNPQTDYAAHGQDATWILLEQFKAAFYEVIMAQLGLVGKAVFYNEYMYSQYGKKGTASVTSEGKYDIPKSAGGTFDPNLLMNFLTGYFKCNNVDVTGNINATTGTFAGFIKIPFEGMSTACLKDPRGRFKLNAKYNLYNDTTAMDLCTLLLDSDTKYDGITLNIYTPPRISRLDPVLQIEGEIYHPKNKNSSGLFVQIPGIYCNSGGYIQLINVGGQWFVTIDAMADESFIIM